MGKGHEVINTPLNGSVMPPLPLRRDFATIGVLLVEDNPGDVRLVREMLVEAGARNARFECAGSAAEAKARLGKGGVDVVLVDLGLPDSRGLDTYRGIREVAGDAVVIIVLTGNQDEETGLAAIREGADDYLIKGQINGPLLVRSVCYAIERRQAELMRSRSLEQQKRVNQLQQALLAPGKLSLKLSTITQGVVDIFGADFCRIWSIGLGDLCERGCMHASVTEGPHVCRPRDKCLQLVSSSGRYTHTDGAAHRRVPFGAYKIGLVASGREHKFLTNNVTRDPRVHNHEWARELGLVSFAGYQIRPPGGETIGVLALFSGQAISPEEDAQLDALSTLVARVIGAAQAEEALRQSETRFRSFFENAPEYCYMVAPGGRILDVNATALAALGYEKSELVDHSTLRIYASESRQAVEKALDEWRQTGTIRGRELEIITKQGTRRSIVLDVSSVCNDQGEILYSISVQRDITQQKELESQFRQAQKMEAVGKLAGGVAHDFNNVLSVILGYAELALAKVDPAQTPYAELQQIRNAGWRAADIIRQLLAFARKQTIAPRVIDLNETVERMLKMLRPIIGEDIELAWMPGHSLWPVKIDPAQIDQILANLSVNARDAIAGVGKVTIETNNVDFDEAYCREYAGFLPGEYVMMAVSDDGCGMGKEVLDQVFEPFFTTKPVGEGTGLGLATVYGIVKQNEGFINVYSEPGKGSTFRIYFSRYAGAVAAEPAEALAEPPRGNAETVLLVEDETAMLNLGQDMLERLGYVVLAANTPGEAIRLGEAHAGEIHLLITDVIMPQMTGPALAERLLSHRPDLKQLFMSGYTADVIAHRGVLAEGVQFLQKPFSIRDLAIKVQQVLQGR
jgi:PAS domain S-box-containing protein